MPEEPKPEDNTFDPPALHVLSGRTLKHGDVLAFRCRIHNKPMSVLVTHDEKLYALITDYSEDAEKPETRVNFWTSAMNEGRVKVVRLVVTRPAECN